jgi:hypothetical protein
LKRSRISQRKVDHTEEQLVWWVVVRRKTLSKHDFILREGEMAKHQAFVISGCSPYTVDAKGKEHHAIRS